MTRLKMSPRQENPQGWWRTVIHNGTTYVVGMERKRKARLIFRPKGQNWGWSWRGFVRTPGGRELWGGMVNSSLGVRGLLVVAEILPRS